MLDNLHVSGFKSWRDHTNLRIAPITVLFGTNSSGKTSLLQLLLLLKQTAESLDPRLVLDLGDASSLVEFGTFQDVIYGHDPSRLLSVGLTWATESTKELRRTGRQTLAADRFSFTCDIALNAQAQLQVEQLQYTIGDRASVTMHRTEDDRYALDSAELVLKRKKGRPWPLPPPVKCYAFPDEVFNYYQNVDFLADLALEFDRLSSNISYVGPLRDYPKRNYLWGGSRPSSVGSRGEHAIEALLAARAEQRKIGRGSGKARRYVDFDVRIGQWLKDMEVIHDFNLREIAKNRKIYELVVRTTADAPPALITDVGFGVSQLLPVLVQSYYAPRGSLVIFEQPEIHLHPKVESHLADVFIDAYTSSGVQFLIESHSEHLLRRLQRRVSEGDVESTDVALYFVNQDDAGGSRLQPLQLDSAGNIRNWPRNFFGDPFDDIRQLARAAAQSTKG